MTHPVAPRPTYNPNNKTLTPRTIDQYFQEAHDATQTSSTHRLYYWFIFIALGIANSGDATEIGCMGYVLAYEPFQTEVLDNDLAGKGAALASSIFAGMLTGGMLAGGIGDKVGRKPLLQLGMILNSFCGILSSFAPSITFLILYRFFSGVGIGAVVSSLIALATELSPQSRRGLYVTFVASFWTLGSITVALLALFLLGKYELGWRIFFLACALPSSIGLILVSFLVPESPRFLALHGRYDDACRSANRIAEDMGYRGMVLHVDEVRHHFADHHKGQQNGGVGGQENKRSWWEEIKHSWRFARVNIANLYSRGVRNTTIPLQLLWFTLSFGAGFCTWVITLFTKIDESNVYFDALLFALSNIPGNIISGIFIDRVGRKSLLLTSLLLCSVSLLGFAMAFKSGWDHTPVLICACTFHALLVVGWCTVSVMSGELFPTTVRAVGMSVCASSGRMAAMLVQFVNGALVGNPFLLVMVASGSMFLGALIPVMLPMNDMSRQPLADKLPEDLALEKNVEIV